MTANVSTCLTYAALAVFLVICGASLFEHAALATSWMDDPPASLQMFRGPHGVSPPRFFRIAHPLFIALFIATLATSWTNADRRPLLLIVGAGYLVAFVTTLLYYAPELQNVIMEPSALPAEEVRTRALRWEWLATARTVGMLGVSV